MTITAIRTVLIYILVIAAMRVMGKRQLGELQPVELVVTLLISDMAAVPMQESGLPLLSGVLPILILVALELLLSGLMLKSPRFSRLVSGNPIVLIQDGQLQQQALKKMRMTVDDLMEALRQQGTFCLGDVQMAVVEPNGHISVLIKPEKQTVTVETAGLTPPDDAVDMVVVSDGSISDWALQVCGLSEAWVTRTLQQHRIALSDVFVMTANKRREVHIIPRQIGGKP